MHLWDFSGESGASDHLVIEILRVGDLVVVMLDLVISTNKL